MTPVTLFMLNISVIYYAYVLEFFETKDEIAIHVHLG
jgi:hypothetical protein